MTFARPEAKATVNLGGLLRAYREAAGLSQTQFMHLLDLTHPSSIHVWETGKRCVPDVYLPRMEAILGRKLPRSGISGEGYDADPSVPSHTHRGRLTKAEEVRRERIRQVQQEMVMLDVALYAFEWWEQDAIDQERRTRARRDRMQSQPPYGIGGLVWGASPSPGRRAA